LFRRLGSCDGQTLNSMKLAVTGFVLKRQAASPAQMPFCSARFSPAAGKWTFFRSPPLLIPDRLSDLTRISALWTSAILLLTICASVCPLFLSPVSLPRAPIPSLTTACWYQRSHASTASATTISAFGSANMREVECRPFQTAALPRDRQEPMRARSCDTIP